MNTYILSYYNTSGVCWQYLPIKTPPDNNAERPKEEVYLSHKTDVRHISDVLDVCGVEYGLDLSSREEIRAVSRREHTRVHHRVVGVGADMRLKHTVGYA